MKRHTYMQMMSVTEAREIFLSRFELNNMLPPEEISTMVARGRVTAAPVWARRSLPATHQAAVDGFAVLAASTFWATPEQPKSLAVGEEAFPINTGHTIPRGTDAVIIVENSSNPKADLITVDAPVFPWHNVRRIGDDLVGGEMVLPKGMEITPLAQGALLAAGSTRVAVRRLPKVIIIPTGSELESTANLDGDLPSDRPSEFSSVILAGLVTEAGGLPEIKAIVPDNITCLTAVLKKALADADVMIINAGSLAGTGNYIYRAVAKMGEVVVHGVSMMPGKPTLLGLIGGKPVIGIPDYPISAVLSFEQFAAPLIAGLAGKRLVPRPTLMVHPAQNLPSKPGMTEFIRVTLGRVGDKVIASPLPRGEGVIPSLVRPDGLLVVPALSEGLEEDRPVAAELLIASEDIEGALVFLGSHDNIIDLLDTFLKRRDPRLRLSSGHLGNQGGLLSLRQGRAHFSASHLFDPETKTYNTRYILRYLPRLPLKLINLAWRERGLMVAEGNPKNIRTIKDLIRPDVRSVNRQQGAGTRVLLDYLLEKHGLDPSMVQGYEREEKTHMAVAVNVHSGIADVGIGTFSAAKALGLDFIPLTPERYDLVVPESTFNDPRFQILLEVMHSQEYQEAVAALGGYDLKDCGKIFWEQ
ncbi:MAG: molybdopterin biosynthesis protein [Syntrophales bacterium]|nr:molybdopterin biosynthesis protein [Syntrophales bacterium]MDD5640367.1 molybdopterin biosynthesis protein [Syntrophales bacterium]